MLDIYVDLYKGVSEADFKFIQEAENLLAEDRSEGRHAQCSLGFCGVHDEDWGLENVVELFHRGQDLLLAARTEPCCQIHDRVSVRLVGHPLYRVVKVIM